MRRSKLWLGCVWTLVVACGSETDTERGAGPLPAEPGAEPAQHEDAGALPPRSDASAQDAGAKAADQTWCDVEPIVRARCASCHQEGGVGPMPLERHEDFLQPSAQYPGSTYYERASVRIHDARRPMPSSGMLEASELAALDAWIAAGAPPAPAAGCAPKSQPAPAEIPWPSHCDATYRITAHAQGSSEPFVVPAGQELHPKVPIDAPWGDEEVQAIAFRPLTDNAKVLHHWILYGSDRTFLTGWAPGGDGGARLPDDVGMYMPHGKGSMYLDMHYYNLGNAQSEPDQSGVEVCVLKKEHFRPLTASVAKGFGSIGGNDFILAPAGQKEHEESGVCPVTVTEPVHLLTASPHAHTHAVHMKFTVRKKDGSVITMHDAPFVFDAQESHALPQEVVLETGDQVITTCTYTNDTTRDVPFGESTTSEMCFNFAVYYPKGALSCGPLIDALLNSF